MPSSRTILALTIAVVLVSFLYRFNALGGSLGGFDGDHFIYYLGAVQVLDGERPLRDFADAGLQGAWPALTYELPALAQRLGGRTLLSEAVFTVGMVTLSLAVLFRSAASIAGPLPALVVTMLTLFASTRLYGYPKVLVSSVAVALMTRYARRQSVNDVALLAVWSAVAFLFRHDYLVYLAPSIGLLVLTLPWPSRREPARHLLLYGVLTALLLVGPLYSIEHFAGLRQYLESALELTRNESSRTGLDWPTLEHTAGGVLAFFQNEANAIATVYYLCLSVPAVAVLGLLVRPTIPGLDERRTRALIVSVALLAFLLNRFLLRGNVPARFGDLGAPVAVLAAWLSTLGRTARTPVRALATATALAVAVAASLAVSTTGSVWQELDTTGLRDSLGKVGRRVVTVTRELSALPGPASGSTAASPDVADYLRTCTGPRDRTLVIADSSEVATFASRPFAAGQATFRPGFYALPADQALMLQRLAAQSVPVVVTEDLESYQQNFASGFAEIDAYVTAHYEVAGDLPALTGGPMRVLTRKTLPPRGTYRDTGLPCFN